MPQRAASPAGSPVARSPPPGSDRQCLRPPVHLGPTMLRHRLDRRAGKAVVGREQPADRLRLIEATVEQEGERAVQSLEDVLAIQEGRGHAQRAVRLPDRYQLAVAEQLLDPAGRDAEAASHLGETETGADERVGREVALCHTPDVATCAPGQTWQIAADVCGSRPPGGAAPGRPAALSRRPRRAAEPPD